MDDILIQFFDPNGTELRAQQTGYPAGSTKQIKQIAMAWEIRYFFPWFFIPSKTAGGVFSMAIC